MIQQTVLPIKIEKTEQEITPFGGLLIFIEAYKAFGLEKAVKELFPEPGSAKGFEANIYIIATLLIFLGGGRFIEDIRKVKLDRALRRLGDIETIPGSDALGDWLRRDSQQKIKWIKMIYKKLIQKIMKKTPITEFTLDIDATGIEADKDSAKKTYKGYKGYMPMLGFLAELDLCIGQELREGNESPASRNLEFIQECEKNMCEGKVITGFRSDSAAYQAEIINYLEEQGIKFTITGCKDAAVLKVISMILEEEWQKLKNKDGYNSGREVAETIHSMEKTKESFRIIVQRYKTEDPQQLSLFDNYSGYHYYVIATNYEQEEKSVEEIIYWHNQRANSENYNKEVKIGFNLEYLPCDDFEANGVWFGLGLLAYNLFIGCKRVILPSTWVKKTIATVRWQLIQIAGKIVKGQRQLKLKLSNISDELMKIFEEARLNCYQLMLSG